MASNFFTDEPMLTEKNVFSVSELNTYVEGLLSTDRLLRSVACEGEISGFKRYYSSGHCYFTLKDDSAAISCVMFKGYADSLRFVPRDGMRVVISGYVSLYVRDGKYQFYVQNMHSVGEGELYAKFLELKEKLEKEGLFSDEHKKDIPFLPKAVGVVTSGSGAVFHDIINVTRRRFPNMHIVLSPCAVQGKDAPREICEALQLIDSSGLCDVVIVGRGGGSMEDLWCFNDESVARAIAACKTPVISAVGHETDFTIADFAADMRAPTPSAAAELAVPVYDEIVQSLNMLERDMRINAELNLKNAEARLDAAMRVLRTPDELFGMSEMKIASLEQQLDDIISQKMTSAEARLEGLLDMLEAMSPYSVLKRGYAIVKTDDDRVVKTAAEFALAETGKITFSDGEVKVRVDS